MRPMQFLLMSVLFMTVRAAAQGVTVREEPPCRTFVFADSVTVHGTPGQVYDGLTGDITAWWDHAMSGKPFKMYIEPKPGGGFYEIFDESGDGVLHATVTFAARGKKLMFVGPLGLAGKAIHMVTTYELTAAGMDSTLLRLQVHATGELAPGLEQMVHGVWKHFLVERFKPFMDAGGVKKR